MNSARVSEWPTFLPNVCRAAEVEIEVKYENPGRSETRETPYWAHRMFNEARI